LAGLPGDGSACFHRCSAIFTVSGGVYALWVLPPTRDTSSLQQRGGMRHSAGRTMADTRDAP
jgi:hypothetical protein